VGEDVGLLYDMLQSPAAIEKLAGNLAAGITPLVTRRGVLAWLRWLVRPVLDKVLKLVATNVARSERKTPLTALSPKAEPGLIEYLSGPLIRQLASEAPNRDGELPTQLKFVFGHTHKPFVATRKIPGLANPVRIFNSGGWVVDTLTVEPLHGCNLILVDEHLEVACVRLYNQSADRQSYKVRLDNGLPAEQGPFYQRLSGLIHADQEPWASFSAACADLVIEREKALDTIITNAGQPRASGSPPPPPEAPPEPELQAPAPQPAPPASTSTDEAETLPGDSHGAGYGDGDGDGDQGEG
jgi:hypothetical protein